jgi:hypothetical protein
MLQNSADVQEGRLLSGAYWEGSICPSGCCPEPTGRGPSRPTVLLVTVNAAARVIKGNATGPCEHNYGDVRGGAVTLHSIKADSWKGRAVAQLIEALCHMGHAVAQLIEALCYKGHAVAQFTEALCHKGRAVAQLIEALRYKGRAVTQLIVALRYKGHAVAHHLRAGRETASASTAHRHTGSSGLLLEATSLLPYKFLET